jgi:hypothetical protein
VDLLTLALVVAIVVWAGRKLLRRRHTFAGDSPDTALLVTSARALEEAREALRCPRCLGPITQLGETSRAGLRVARGRCLNCDLDADMYFRLPNQLLH